MALLCIPVYIMHCTVLYYRKYKQRLSIYQAENRERDKTEDSLGPTNQCSALRDN